MNSFICKIKKKMSTTKNENKKDFRLCVTSNGFRLCVTLNHRDVRIYKSDINNFT